MSIVRTHLLFFSIYTFFAASAHAGNGLVSAAWNQVRSGQFCGQVKDTEISKAGYSCPVEENRSVLSLQSSANEILDKLVFEEAAEKQIRGDKCVSEALNAIQKDEAKKRKWQGVLVASWLGLKKSQLMLDHCQRLFYNSISSKNQKRYGLAEAYAKTPLNRWHRVPIEVRNAWKDVCLNDETYAALKKAEELFSLSLPVVSSPEAYAAIERNRQAVVNRATGKPITDEELLKMDLTNLSQVTVASGNDALEKDLSSFLSGHSSQRIKMVALLEEAKGARGGLQDLSSQVRSYLYEEGTVSQVMIDRGMMKVGPLGQPTEVSAGAACIMAWNDPTLVGEIAEFAATSVLAGGILYKILGASSKFAQAAKSSRLKTSMLWGAAGVGIKDSIQQIHRSCISQEGTTPRLSSMAQQDKFVSIEGTTFPKEIGFDRWNFEFDKAEVPSCAQTTGPNLLVNRAFEANCARDVLLSVLPIYLGLPYAFASF